MGRRDAVQFTLEWAAEARRLGAIVEFEPGWETRGNGMSANYEAMELHHTAFLSSQANPFPAKNTLKNGRIDLGGPLANVGGPWCEDGAPRLVVIAAHPSNNAGASGGRNTAPLPVTSLFNPLVFALEIDYGGLVPMTKGQRKAATIFSRAGINVLKKSTDWVKAHADTSITGKWDPGYANGKTIDMGEFRRGVANFAGKQTPQPSEEDEPMIVNVEPGHYEVVPLPTIPDGKKLFARFAVDEEGGGCNVRIAVGWGQGKWYALPDFDKDDGYIGWLFNGAPYEVELAAPASVLSVRHLGSRASLGVLLELR